MMAFQPTLPAGIDRRIYVLWWVSLPFAGTVS